MTVETFSYTNPRVPKDYVCARCGAVNCKLWREYQTFSPITLTCCDCAAALEGEDVSRIDEEGKIPFRLSLSEEHEQWADSIGWRVPAVPTPNLDGYWGYTSVPQPGVEWWKALPTRSQV